MLRHYAEQIQDIQALGTEVAIVIGGGNIYRGLQAQDSGIERVQVIIYGHAIHRD